MGLLAVRRRGGGGGRSAHLLPAVLQGVLLLGQLLVLVALDAARLVPQTSGVLLLQTLDGLLLLPLQVLHLLVVLPLLTLPGPRSEVRGQRSEVRGQRAKYRHIGCHSVYIVVSWGREAPLALR